MPRAEILGGFVMSILLMGWSGLVLPSSTVRAQEKGDSGAQRQLQKLLDDDWEFRVRENPLEATRVGDRRFDDRLPRQTIADQRRRFEEKRRLLNRLKNIDRGKLPPASRRNSAVLEQLLTHEVGDLELESYLIPITNRWGFHVDFPELSKRMPLDNVQDYKNYISRLRAFDRYVQDHIELMREGVKKGWVLPAVVLQDYSSTITAHIVDDSERSLLFEAFSTFPESIPEPERLRLTAQGKNAIAQSVTPGYRRFLKFMQKEYLPAARGSIAASALPGGRAYYRHCVKKYTTLDISPMEVHRIGQAEVKRIRAEMQQVIKAVKFEGSFSQFVHFLRTEPRFYAKTADELLKETALVLKRMDGRLPKLFGALPRMPYGIREVPDYIAPLTSSAYYSLPSGDGRDAGYYYVNTYNLKSRPLYQVEALSLHEAVPGHHLQLALQQEMEDLPNFRRYAEAFTAYVEGWALYAERLGLEVGFYKDPYSNFGRLSYEMWRACRLVVDTGMHYLGWTRKRAIDFMAENTSLSLHNIQAEVDRYISWPGQALGYKMGELKIRQLRRLAEKELGNRFDLREFHDVVLSGGAVPLSVLETDVKHWLAQKTKSKTALPE